MNNIINPAQIQQTSMKKAAIADRPGLQPNLHKWQPGDIVFKRGSELDIANALLVVQTNIIAPPGQVGVVFFCPYYQRVDAITGQPLNPNQARFLPLVELFHYSEFGLKLMDDSFDQYLCWKVQNTLAQVDSEAPGIIPEDEPPHP